MTRRAALKAAGSVAPISWQQVTGPGSQNPSAATGVSDGNKAVSLMGTEIESGSCVYLDLENGPPLTDLQRDYVANWCDTVQSGGFSAGSLLQSFAGS